MFAEKHFLAILRICALINGPRLCSAKDVTFGENIFFISAMIAVRQRVISLTTRSLNFTYYVRRPFLSSPQNIEVVLDKKKITENGEMERAQHIFLCSFSL